LDLHFDFHISIAFLNDAASLVFFSILVRDDGDHVHDHGHRDDHDVRLLLLD
jgi:hypothetical protein